MARRSTTEHCFVVGIDKPAGMSSHDVVNRVRRIYGERRCGHMGTLDPAATGALAVCVGPATRLDALLTTHDKAYEFTIVFGSVTDTDDAEGTMVKSMPVPDWLFEDFISASCHVEDLQGRHKQIPPSYSAIKVAGQKSYEAARSGKVLNLAPRDIEIYKAQLIAIEGTPDRPIWRVRVEVSAGTYVRSIARDLGYALQTCAHVGQLRRIQTGLLHVANCVSLERLEAEPFSHQIDPVKLLGLRFLFADENQAANVAVGKWLQARNLELYRYAKQAALEVDFDACTSGVLLSQDPLQDGESVSIIVDNQLKAVYEYDAAKKILKSRCGFARGVMRGGRI